MVRSQTTYKGGGGEAMYYQRGEGERKNEMNYVVVSTPASRLPKQLWALFLFLTERKIISQTLDKPHTEGQW